MEIDINAIKSPADIKNLNMEQLELLSEELRATLLQKLSAHGGHVGPNLGVVEATVALHYVFDAPKDEIVYDVSHQTYIHKMLTGRIDAFTNPQHYNDVSGYTNPKESNYDLFNIGHTSTSISLAIGLAKARDLKGEHQNVIAFIGDASLGGGMALEGLDYAPTLKSNFILIVNDNQRSIAENHGELYDHLAELRHTNGQSDNNIFKSLGYDYIYVEEGNDIKQLIKAFKQVKDIDHAVVVHINTMKGMGLPVAEKNKEYFHFSSPFNLKTGAPKTPYDGESYDDMLAEKLLVMMRDNKNVVALTAGTPAVLGFTEDRRKAAGSQFIDVGIAEQNCVSITAGLAKGGAKPLMGVTATFIQRAYDQLSHDVAINNLPAVFVSFYAGVYGLNDSTHLGFFDVAMISNIPNIVMLSATSAEEFLAMVDYAMNQSEHPIVIRTPGGAVRHQQQPVNTDFFKYDLVETGDKVAIIAEGAMLANALEAARILRQKGINPTVINPRILSALDTQTLDTLLDYRHVITIDDGIIDGAMGQKIAAYLAPRNVKVTCLGLKKEFLDRYDAKKVLETNNLTPVQIAEIAL